MAERVHYFGVLLGLICSAALSPTVARGAAEDDAAFVRGRAVFGVCRGCHTVNPGEASLMKGPSLAGIIGRKAGTLKGYVDYSKAMTASGITWNPATLERYLADPKALVPGNRMAFVGLPDAEDRRAVVAYLQKVTTPEETAESEDSGVLMLHKADLSKE